MAKANILEVILKTINDVKQKNANNPRQETAHPNVFDLIKDKIGGLDKKIQENRAKKGKAPISILDLIKGQIEAARQHNQQDQNIPTADSNIFDSILKKVEEKPKRTASAGIRRVIEEYNLDVSRLNRSTLQQIQQQYDQDLRALGQKYAQGIQDLVNRS
ncbi:MAG: hypothetical protein AB8G86_17005 [Saprospiraceae bacterium]